VLLYGEVDDVRTKAKDESVTPFRGKLCMPQIMGKWQNPLSVKNGTMRFVSTHSFLLCRKGGIIEPISSGQEYVDPGFSTALGEANQRTLSASDMPQLNRDYHNEVARRVGLETQEAMREAAIMDLQVQNYILADFNAEYKLKIMESDYKRNPEGFRKSELFPEFVASYEKTFHDNFDDERSHGHFADFLEELTR
jgi:hypothetical protein